MNVSDCEHLQQVRDTLSKLGLDASGDTVMDTGSPVGTSAHAANHGHHYQDLSELARSIVRDPEQTAKLKRAYLANLTSHNRPVDAVFMQDYFDIANSKQLLQINTSGSAKLSSRKSRLNMSLAIEFPFARTGISTSLN